MTGGRLAPLSLSFESRGHGCWRIGLKNVATEILILDGVGEHFLNVSRVDRLVLWLQVRPLKTDFVQQPLHDRVQAASADVFGLLIYLRGKIGNGINRIGCKLKFDAFCL